jgi:hypothetical protein
MIKTLQEALRLQWRKIAIIGGNELKRTRKGAMSRNIHRHGGDLSFGELGENTSRREMVSSAHRGKFRTLTGGWTLTTSREPLTI